MSDPTGAVPAEGMPTTASEPASTPEWAPVLDRVGELASTVGELQSGFQSFMQAQQPEPDPEPDPWAGLFEDPNAEVDPNAGLYGQQPQPSLDPQALQSAFHQAVQQANAPLAAQLQQLQTERAHEQLISRIPQLADTPENAETRQQTAALVQQSIAQYPPQVQQALMNDPGYIERVFKAAEAEKLAQGQAPAGGQVPQVEAAGGAVPGGNGEQPNIVHQVYANRPGQMPKGFR